MPSHAQTDEKFPTESFPATAPLAPELSILIISYNTREMTLECLRSIYAETRRTSFETIVVDNISADGSAEAVAREFPQVTLMAEQENHGFAKGNNLAAARASGRYLLLLNPDTVVLDGAIDKLMDFARRAPQARIWGGKTLFGDRTLNPTSCWRRMTLWNVFCRTTGLSGIAKRSQLFNGEGYGAWDRGEERAVDIVTGCFFLVETPLWRQLGGFDLTYVMYGEEADMCLRAKDLNADPRVTPEAVIVHYGGASEKVRADKMVRLFRAKITLIRRHFPVWQRGLGRVLFSLWPLTRLIATSVLSRLTGRAGLRESAQVWGEVWRRRAEWIDGYPDLPV